jgi:capsular polysaccharide biosynthesis protein
MLFEPEGGEWVLKPLDRDTYPIDIKLMLHSRAIFTQISTMNQYGLYRMEDLMEGDSALPWLPIDALVVRVERSHNHKHLYLHNIPPSLSMVVANMCIY